MLKVYCLVKDSHNKYKKLYCHCEPLINPTLRFNMGLPGILGMGKNIGPEAQEFDVGGPEPL